MAWVFAVPTTWPRITFYSLEEVLPKMKDQLLLLCWNLHSATSCLLDQVYNSK